MMPTTSAASIPSRSVTISDWNMADRSSDVYAAPGGPRCRAAHLLHRRAGRSRPLRRVAARAGALGSDGRTVGLLRGVARSSTLGPGAGGAVALDLMGVTRHAKHLPAADHLLKPLDLPA